MTATYDLRADLARYNRGIAASRAAYYREVFGRCAKGHRLNDSKAVCLACWQQSREPKRTPLPTVSDGRENRPRTRRKSAPERRANAIAQGPTDRKDTTG